MPDQFDSHPALIDLKDRAAAFAPRMPAADLVVAAEAGLRAAETLLPLDPPAARLALWTSYFARLYRFAPSYQAQDFEIMDYGLAAVPGVRRPVRGPVPDADALAAGKYICLLGAAQFFGRFAPRTLADRLAAATGLPVLNLSWGAAGPHDFLDESLLPFVRNARVVVAQMLSGRSVKLDGFSGRGVSAVVDGRSVPREHVLRDILAASEIEYRQVLANMMTRYVEGYAALSEAAEERGLLLWISPRAPRQWSMEKGAKPGFFGTFPQLVGEETFRRTSALFGRTAVVTHELQSIAFVSRVTGEAAPFLLNDGRLAWTSDYYPPPAAQDQMFAAAWPHVEMLVDRSPRRRKPVRVDVPPPAADTPREASPPAAKRRRRKRVVRGPAAGTAPAQSPAAQPRRLAALPTAAVAWLFRRLR